VICSSLLFAPETLLHFAGQNGSSHIKMKL